MLELRNYRHIEILGKNTMRAARESMLRKDQEQQGVCQPAVLSCWHRLYDPINSKAGFRRNTMNISGIVYKRSNGKILKLNTETVSAEENSAGYLSRLSQNI